MVLLRHSITVGAARQYSKRKVQAVLLAGHQREKATPRVPLGVQLSSPMRTGVGR